MGLLSKVKNLFKKKEKVKQIDVQATQQAPVRSIDLGTQTSSGVQRVGAITIYGQTPGQTPVKISRTGSSGSGASESYSVEVPLTPGASEKPIEAQKSFKVDQTALSNQQRIDKYRRGTIQDTKSQPVQFFLDPYLTRDKAKQVIYVDPFADKRFGGSRSATGEERTQFEEAERQSVLKSSVGFFETKTGTRDITIQEYQQRTGSLPKEYYSRLSDLGQGISSPEKDVEVPGFIKSIGLSKPYKDIDKEGIFLYGTRQFVGGVDKGLRAVGIKPEELPGGNIKVSLVPVSEIVKSAFFSPAFTLRTDIARSIGQESKVVFSGLKQKAGSLTETDIAFNVQTGSGKIQQGIASSKTGFLGSGEANVYASKGAGALIERSRGIRFPSGEVFEKINLKTFSASELGLSAGKGKTILQIGRGKVLAGKESTEFVGSSIGYRINERLTASMGGTATQFGNVKSVGLILDTGRTSNLYKFIPKASDGSSLLTQFTAQQSVAKQLTSQLSAENIARAGITELTKDTSVSVPIAKAVGGSVGAGTTLTPSTKATTDVSLNVPVVKEATNLGSISRTFVVPNIAQGTGQLPGQRSGQGSASKSIQAEITIQQPRTDLGVRTDVIQTAKLKTNLKTLLNLRLLTAQQTKTTGSPFFTIPRIPRIPIGKIGLSMKDLGLNVGLGGKGKKRDPIYYTPDFTANVLGIKGTEKSIRSIEKSASMKAIGIRKIPGLY